MGENASFMVQAKEEMKVFPEVCSRYLQDIIMPSGTMQFPIQRKEVQINVQEDYWFGGQFQVCFLGSSGATLDYVFA